MRQHPFHENDLGFAAKVKSDYTLLVFILSFLLLGTATMMIGAYGDYRAQKAWHLGFENAKQIYGAEAQ